MTDEDSGTGHGSKRRSPHLVDPAPETGIDSPNGEVGSIAANTDATDSGDAAAGSAVLIEEPAWPDLRKGNWRWLALSLLYAGLGIYLLREAWVTFKEYRGE